MSNPPSACTLNHVSIETLASYQQSQGTSNNCVLHSIATVLNMQLGTQLSGTELAQKIDALWTRKPFLYRTYPGFATTPGQAKRIIILLAREYMFKVHMRLFRPNDLYLQDLLRFSKNTYPIVTVLWITRVPTLLTHQGVTEIPMHAAAKIGGHTMLLAAYDPTVVDHAGVSHPWGFINSWATGPSRDIFWMSQDTWTHLIKLNTLLVQFD